MKCPECGYENREEARFCLECGAKLENVCPQCGARLPPGAKFCDDCGARLPGTPSATPPRLEDMQKQLQDRIPQSLADKLFAGAKQMQGEYRLVTALFADVSGSSGMARELPLEQYVETMNDCFKMMVDTISIKYEGSINRFIGDCVLAFFGAPITHENDAERAILAALDIREGVKELGLDVSTGINTGMTYVGEMGSDLTYSERSAWGPDVDFARRLQEAAGPGQIWVGASTYRLTRRAFDFSKTVEIEAKGATGSAYPVLHVKEHPEKLRGIEGLRARMIGREREFSDLKEAADGLISGRGSIVTIIGEAGLGKSRLAWELKEYVRERVSEGVGERESEKTGKRESEKARERESGGVDERVSEGVGERVSEKERGYVSLSILEGRSISIGQTVSYWPFLDILRTYLDLRDTDTESDIARKLRKAITDLFPQGWEDVLPFMGRLLSINLGDDIERKLSYYTPEQIRHQTLMRMRGVFTAISRRKPLLLILEDMHWSDDLSMDLVSLLMDDLAENPLMLLCIYRPERGHRCWQLGDIASRKCLERYTEITLKKLSSAQSRQLVESLLEIENLPEATRDMILRKSEGNPFFIEEVIRYFIDRDLIYREDDRWKARREIEDIDVPDTIQSVLLSRVDRLEAETRYVLQCASVIGRLFRYRLLEHLSRHERDLEEHLSELEDRELVIEERTVPELEYSFKHALTQEATYQSILERRRRQFHQRVAEGIEALYQERVEDFYEELAHHYGLSGDDEKAIDYLLKSGIKLANQYSNNEALRYFNEAERLIAESGIEYRKEKAILYRKRGSLLNRLGQWVKALRDYEEALQWSDDPHDRADLYLELGWITRMGTARGIRMRELGLQELPDGDKSKQRVLLEKSMFSYIGGEDALRGLYHLAEICQEMGDEGLLAIVYLEIARIQSFMGNYSDEYSQKAISILEKLGDLPSLQKMCSTLGMLMLWYRTGLEWIPKSVPYFMRAIEIAEQIGDIRQQAVELASLGVAYNRLGEYDKAIESSEKALGMFSETKDLHALSSVISILEVYAKLRQDDLVISTYKRIMRALASLELDEESQSMALLIPWNGAFPGCNEMYRPYLKFRNSYSIMGKESEFPGIARETLEDLLEYVDSRPQVAWYHIMLMDLCLELGDMSSARIHAEEVMSIVDAMGRPHYMSGLYTAYILLNDIETANELAYTFITHQSHPRRFPPDISIAIGSMELTYRRFGYTEAFEQICDRLESEYRDELRELGLGQFYLKPAECPASFSDLEFEDIFDWDVMEKPPAPWEWIDHDGMSSYEVCHDPRCIKITSAYGSEIRRGTSMAPRLSRQFSGDFAIETRMGDEKYGGLFIWRDGVGVSFKIWIWGGGAIVLMNRNIINACGYLEADLLTLRLERKGSMFRAYCKGDGEQWYSCGSTECEIEDPVQVGIFGSCHEDTQQIVTSFDYFRIYRE